MPEPITTWVTTLTRSSANPTGICPDIVGVTAKARPSESTTFAIAGTAREENGGTRASHATIRTEASRYAISGSPARVSVIGQASAQQARDAVEQVDREVDHRVQHPVAADQQCDADPDELGHEREREL